MRIGITGAGGFVGSAVTARLASELEGGRAGSAHVVAIDAKLPSDLHPSIEQAEGDISDAAFLDKIFSTPFDAFLHLASVPGGAVARDYGLGWRVNVEASVALLERLSAQEKPPRLVFASSIGVFGTPYPPDEVNDDTLPLPTFSYGAQKLILEVLVSDFARRGLIDGISVRLSGILARPRIKGGLLSAYMSDILHALRAGEPYTCPVGEDATSWFMSRARCVDNLLHALRLPADQIPIRRAFTFPALRLSMKELVDAACAHFGEQARGLVTYQPDPSLQAQFGSYPPLYTPIADAAGFCHDGNGVELVANALELPKGVSR